MTKQASLFVAFLIGAGSLIGCKSNSSKSAENELVVVSYPGDAQIPYRKFLADPFEKKHVGTSVRLVPSESEDVVAQIKAARGSSPYDLITLGVPRQITAVQEGWVEQTPVADLPNLSRVYPQFISACKNTGVPETYSLIGIAYNPDKVPAPESWSDLWKPEYRGKLGMTTPASNLGFGLVVMTAKLAGGSEENLAPAWPKLKELGPFVVAPSPEALAQLFERGEVSIAPMWNNDAAILALHGMKLKFVQPKPGAIVVVSCMDVVKNSAQQKLARQFLNDEVSKEFQSHLAQAPWFFGPTNMDVSIPSGSAEYMPTTVEGLQHSVYFDWDKAVLQRAEATEEFDREFSR
jgi:putative spermidine/putrescine transport system substrate-binding protein